MTIFISQEASFSASQEHVLIKCRRSGGRSNVDRRGKFSPEKEESEDIFIVI